MTAKIIAGRDVAERLGLRVRDRVLHGPEDYSDTPPEYRLWLWAADVGDAVSRLNPTPARAWG